MTPTVTFNPYLPAIGRVLEVLRSYGPGTTIEICNRDLGHAAGCSAGRVPALLRTLEADEMIERVTGPRGSLIQVTERSTMVDRMNSASGCDQESDRSIEVDSANRTETPDRSAAQPLSDQSSDQFIDPPHTPLYGNKHESMQQQPREALRQAIIDVGGLAIVEEILTKNPDLTLTEFEALRQAARRRGNHQSPESIGLVFWCLQTGQPLHSPKEPRDERPPARRSAPNRPQRSDAAAPVVDYTALLAEWRAAEPGGAAALPLRRERPAAHAG